MDARKRYEGPAEGGAGVVLTKCHHLDLTTLTVFSLKPEVRFIANINTVGTYAACLVIFSGCQQKRPDNVHRPRGPQAPTNEQNH